MQSVVKIGVSSLFPPSRQIHPTVMPPTLPKRPVRMVGPKRLLTVANRKPRWSRKNLKLGEISSGAKKPPSEMLQEGTVIFPRAVLGWSGAPLPCVHAPSAFLCSSLLSRPWILPTQMEPTAPHTLRLPVPPRTTPACRRHGGTTAPGPRGPPTPPSPRACTGPRRPLPPGATPRRTALPRGPLSGGSRFLATPHRR